MPNRDGLPIRVGTAYSWDGHVIAENAPLMSDGETRWHEATRWQYEPGTFRPLAKQTPGGKLIYIVTDHLGTPREMFSEGGRLVWAAEYRTWGAIRRLWQAEADNDNHPGFGAGGRSITFGALALQSEPAWQQAMQNCPIRFQGQWEDAETGLNYNRFRHYDPLIAQYTCPDPVGLLGGTRPLGYVHNPNQWIDPLGLAPKKRYNQAGQELVPVDHKPKGPLDWGGDDPNFPSRKDHVRNHGADIPDRNTAHGVFNDNPIITTQQAWQRAVENGIQPYQIGGSGNWIYDIPMPSAGTQLGKSTVAGYGTSTSHVRIVTSPGTNRVITSYPVNLDY